MEITGNNQPTTLSTSLGFLSVSLSGYTGEDYPGYIIQLNDQDGVELASVLMEVDQTNEEPCVKVHVWDTKCDEPICRLVGFKNNDGSVKLEY